MSKNNSKDSGHESTNQITHQMITKLATLRAQSMTINEVLPDLLKSYHLAVEKNLVDEIDKDLLDAISDIFNLEEQISSLFNLVEQLRDISNA